MHHGRRFVNDRAARSSVDGRRRHLDLITAITEQRQRYYKPLDTVQLLATPHVASARPTATCRTCTLSTCVRPGNVRVSAQRDARLRFVLCGNGSAIALLKLARCGVSATKQLRLAGR